MFRRIRFSFIELMIVVLILACLAVVLPKPVLAQSSDALGPTSSPAVNGWLYGYNGATWDRLRTTGTGTLLVSPSGTAAAALADTTANPTTTVIGTDNFVFNGTTWDRWRGSSLTNGTGIAKVTIAGVGDPCLSSEIPKLSVVINISTATTTQLVALSGSTIVYVCSVNLTISQVVTTANILTFVYGTGSSCATGQVALTGGFGTGGVTAAPPLVLTMGASGGTIFKNIAGNALCATTTIGGSGAFTGVLTYVQI